MDGDIHKFIWRNPEHTSDLKCGRFIQVFTFISCFCIF